MSLNGFRPSRPRYAPPLVGSVVMHVLLGVLVWAFAQIEPEPIQFESFAIDLYSPPPNVLAEEFAPGRNGLIVEAPQAPEPPPPEPPAPEPQAEIKAPEPEKKPEPRPTENKPPTQANNVLNAEAPKGPSRGPDAVAGSPGGENINVHMAGLQRDYPAYYNTIVTQISRCFNQRRTNQSRGERWEAKIDFVIGKDGKIAEEDVKVFKASGSQAFDYLALGAVECASGRFGALPDDMPMDRLPIRFTFTPAGAGGPDM
jgi:outer membrane biosynthesis protein TonB